MVFEAQTVSATRQPNNIAVRFLGLVLGRFRLTARLQGWPVSDT